MPTSTPTTAATIASPAAIRRAMRWSAPAGRARRAAGRGPHRPCAPPPRRRRRAGMSSATSAITISSTSAGFEWRRRRIGAEALRARHRRRSGCPRPRRSRGPWAEQPVGGDLPPRRRRAAAARARAGRRASPAAWRARPSRKARRARGSARARRKTGRSPSASGAQPPAAPRLGTPSDVPTSTVVGSWRSVSTASRACRRSARSAEIVGSDAASSSAATPSPTPSAW